MRLMISLLLLLSTVAYPASEIIPLESATVIIPPSATLMITALTPEEQRFADTVRTHFKHAKSCWKQSQIPSDKIIDKTILGCLTASRRFWKNRPDIPYKLFALLISESGGLNVGNPNDPSYGMCHIKFHTAHHACQVFGIQHPKNKYCTPWCNGLAIKGKNTFTYWLENDILFNIACSAAALNDAEDRAYGDWVRAVLIYKCGISRLSNMANTANTPITENTTWIHYSKVYSWIKCINERIQTDTMVDCGCLPVEGPR